MYSIETFFSEKLNNLQRAISSVAELTYFSISKFNLLMEAAIFSRIIKQISFDTNSYTSLKLKALKFLNFLQRLYKNFIQRESFFSMQVNK